MEWQRRHGGVNSSFEGYIKPSPHYQFAFVLSSAFFPSTEINNVTMQLHRYSGLFKGEVLVLNRKLKTLGIGASGGYGGLTLNVRNDEVQGVKVKNAIVEPGNVSTVSVKGSSAGLSLKYTRYVTAASNISASGDYSAGSVLSLSAEGGTIYNSYDEAVYSDNSDILYYLKFSLGGGIFSFRP